MKKIKTRLFTSLTAAALAVSSFSALGASAILIAGNSDELTERMNNAEYATYVPEAIDNFAYIMSNYSYLVGNITEADITTRAEKEKRAIDNGFWLTAEYCSPLDSNTLYFEYKNLWEDFAIFEFDVPSGDCSAVVEEFKAEIGYSDKIDIRAYNDIFNHYGIYFSEYYDTNKYADGTPLGEIAKDYADVGILIRFSEHGTEFNYMIAEKAASILKEKYNVTESRVGIGRASLENMQITLPSCPASKIYEAEALTAEQLEDFNNTLAENGFNIRSHRITDEEIEELYRIDEERKEAYLKELENTDDIDLINFHNENPSYIDEMFYTNYDDYKSFTFVLDIPDDTTIEEKLRYVRLVQENYGVNPFIYSLASAEQTGESFDILEVETSYKKSDANEDGKVSAADAVAVIQAIGNPDKYALTAQGEFNADADGNGLTAADALAIQKIIAQEGMPE